MKYEALMQQIKDNPFLVQWLKQFELNKYQIVNCDALDCRCGIVIWFYPYYFCEIKFKSASMVVDEDNYSITIILNPNQKPISEEQLKVNDSFQCWLNHLNQDKVLKTATYQNFQEIFYLLRKLHDATIHRTLKHVVIDSNISLYKTPKYWLTTNYDEILAYHFKQTRTITFSQRCKFFCFINALIGIFADFIWSKN